MWPAIFGLLGVIVGGLLAAAGNYWLERRRERALIRQAKLLVSEELRTAWAQLGTVEEKKSTPSKFVLEASGMLLPTVMWAEHRATLALKGVVSDDEWSDLSALYQKLNGTRLALLALGPKSQLSPDVAAEWGGYGSHAASLYEVLTGRAPYDGPVE